MAQLLGTVYEDSNANGIQDGSEAGLSNWTVLVDFDGDGVQDPEDYTTTTDGNGDYSLDGIAAGTYEVRILDPDGNLITFDQVDFSPTNPNGWLPSEPDFPDDPVVGDRYYLVEFSDTGAMIGQVDFEDAEARLGIVPPDDADDTALTSGTPPTGNQVWSDLGFEFYLDNNQNFIADDQVGEPGGTMFLEKSGGQIGLPSPETNAFVNDLATGPFDIPNRASQLVFDTTNAPEEDLLGNYFLRGGGLYAGDGSTIPTLLIKYNTPTGAASGVIVDIDTTYAAQLLGQEEQWRVEWFDGSQNLLGSQDSPQGESVWIPDADGVIDADGYADWDVNPNSLDGKGWEWSFTRPQADVEYVRISYIGDKGLDDGSFVGLAFDKFSAFDVDKETADFGVFQPVNIGDYVWEDDGNGIQDEPASAGINGVPVNLIDVGPDGDINTPDDVGIVATTQTANDGSGNPGYYLFENVRPGNYVVQFVNNLPGFIFTPANQGGDDALDSDVTNPATGNTDPITVISGQPDDLTIDAGLIDTNVPLVASLGDFVWHDVDGDGIQDAEEPGVAGVKVELLDSNMDPIAGGTFAFTDGNGEYLFDNLDPGDYFVRFSRPTGYDGFTTPNVGPDDAVDSDADPITGKTGVITLDPGEEDLTNDAGLLKFNNGGEGLTPGFWKTHGDPENTKKYAWEPTGYTPDQLYGDVFGVNPLDGLSPTEIAEVDTNGNGLELIEAVGYKGNITGFQALARHSVAALLNAGHPDISYLFTEAQVIGQVQSAYQFAVDNGYSLGGYSDPIVKDFANDIKDTLMVQNELGAIL